MSGEAAAVPRVDAHHHFWRYADAHCEWMPDAPKVLHRNYLVEDLAPLLEGAAIAGTVLVQAAQTPVETEWLLALAERTPSVWGVVGWVDSASEDAVDLAETWRTTGQLVGIRLWNQDDPDGDRLRSAIGSPLLHWAARHGTPLDLLIRPHHLTAAAELIETTPAVRFVVDHGAKPDIARWTPRNAEFCKWREEMQRLADHPTVSCKLSGLVTEAAPQWSPDDIKPYFDALLEMFGPTRLLWGSDWPVSLTASAYQLWVDCAEWLLGEVSSNDRAAIFGGNAIHFYALSWR